jgi:hypothetical protein
MERTKTSLYHKIFHACTNKKTSWNKSRKDTSNCIIAFVDNTKIKQTGASQIPSDEVLFKSGRIWLKYYNIWAIKLVHHTIRDGGSNSKLEGLECYASFEENQEIQKN